MNMIKKVIKIFDILLQKRLTVGGVNPFFNILHPEFLATYGLNKQLKQDFSVIRGKLLDLGCGMKPYGRFLDNSVEHIGVDIYSESYADKLMIDGKTIPYEDKMFDWVISTNVIEHIKELDVVVEEIKRVSKDDSKFIITIPFMFHEHGSPFDFRRFTKFGLENYFKTKGFSITKVETFGGIGSYLIVGFLSWIDISISSIRKNGKIIKILMLPIHILIVIFLNMLGWILNKLDNTDKFYNCTHVHMTKESR